MLSPLGVKNEWSPADTEQLMTVGPALMIILLNTMSNTMLVPLLPFITTSVGAHPFYYGLLQSSFWITQMVAAPIIGAISDKFGRQLIIVLTLLISAAGHATLAIAWNLQMIFLARTITGLGFQIVLLRAFFADNTPKESRAGSFGLIGVINGLGLILGPSLGGQLAYYNSALPLWCAAALNVLSAVFSMCWTPKSPEAKPATMTRSYSRPDMAKEQVQWVRVELDAADQTKPAVPKQSQSWCTRMTEKMKTFWGWAVEHRLFVLLAINFCFRFGFSVYKSVFAFFCMKQFGYDSRKVGYVLSVMGAAGIFVQGVLLRIIMARISEGQALVWAMFVTSFALIGMGYCDSEVMFMVYLILISVGYGLTVPNLSALFSHVPLPQGAIQGVAGAIDRLGQAFGPLIGLQAVGTLSEGTVLWCTGVELFFVGVIAIFSFKFEDADDPSGHSGVWHRIKKWFTGGYSKVAQTEHDSAEMLPLTSEQGPILDTSPTQEQMEEMEEHDRGVGVQDLDPKIGTPMPSLDEVVPIIKAPPVARPA